MAKYSVPVFIIVLALLMCVAMRQEPLSQNEISEYHSRCIKHGGEPVDTIRANDKGIIQVICR